MLLCCTSMRSGCLAACVVALLGAASQAEGPFLGLSFEEAKARADKERKPIFIDFFTTWCGPCRMLEQQTWKDPKAIEWLGRRTIPLKIDAEKEERLAGRYRVEAYPTLLFLKSDGMELDRIVGFIEAKEFIQEGEGILSGKDALTRAREKLEAAGVNNPIARMEYARKLAEKDKPAEALKEYLWCFDEGLGHNVAFAGVRLSFLLSNIKDLGQSYPPALDALGERFNKAREQVLAGQGGLQAVMDFASLSETLDEGQQAMAIYQQLKKQHPDSPAVGYLRDQLFDRLREQHQYGELYNEKELKQKVEMAFQNLRPNWLAKLFMLRLSKEQRERIWQQQFWYHLHQLGVCYEVMIGSGHEEEAAKLAARVLKADSTAETYNLLAWYGYVTGRPVKANLDQSEKAYELSKGKNAGIVDTYARYLTAFDRKSEGLAILRRALEQAPDDESKAILSKCLAELESLPASSRKATPVVITVIGSAAVLVAALVILYRQRRNRPIVE